MKRDLETMKTIQEERAKEMESEAMQPLDEEGKKLAEHKRFTFDVIDTPVDPLR